MAIRADRRVDLLQEARLNDPFAFLGLHEEKGGLIGRAFVPWAGKLSVLDAKDGSLVAELPRATDDGLFEGKLDRPKRFAYRLRAETDGRVVDFEDPYRFGPTLGELDRHLLGEGRHQRAFETLGARPLTIEGVEGVGFAVWAPNASAVSVVGAFNDWDGRRHPMRLHPGIGVWDLFLPHVPSGVPYKFQIHGPNGELDRKNVV